MSPQADATDRPSPALVDRARDGDEEALAELVAEVHPLVHRWALVRTGDETEADDLTQEVLVRVVRKLPTYRGEARFTTWLYRVVANAAVDRERRRSTRLERRDDRARVRARPAPQTDPAERLDRSRILERVRSAFRALPERQRQVFDLADLQGLDGPEIADRLGIAPSTVRVHLLKARRAIRKRILETDPELAKEFRP